MPAKVSGVMAYLVVLLLQKFSVWALDSPKVCLFVIKLNVNHGGKLFHGSVCPACGLCF
jgi:hypothetical protein